MTNALPITRMKGVAKAAAEQRTVSPHRKTSLAAGVLYLLTFVSIPTLFLYVPVHAAKYIVGPGPDTGVLVGAILEMIVALAASALLSRCTR